MKLEHFPYLHASPFMRKLYLKLWAASLCAVFACSLPQSLARSHEVDVLAVKPHKAIQSISLPKVVLVSYLSPAAVPAAPAAVQGYSGTGDANLDYIVQHESSGNPYAINEIGACGLGQALPCSKLLVVCGSLSNIQCQIQWVKDYATSTYGSPYQAWLFWQSHHWY